MLICLQVMFFSAVPAPATLPFQFTCTFIAVVTRRAVLKWLFWLTVQLSVILKKMSQASLVAPYIYNKRYFGGPREWMKYALNCSRPRDWLFSLPGSQRSPWPLRHRRWYPSTGQPPVRESGWSGLWLLVELWVLPHRDIVNVPGKVSQSQPNV